MSWFILITIQLGRILSPIQAKQPGCFSVLNYEIPSREINMAPCFFPFLSKYHQNAGLFLVNTLKRKHFKRKLFIFQPSIFRGCDVLVYWRLIFFLGICHTKHLYAQTG